jgi:hypothetical protein
MTMALCWTLALQAQASKSLTPDQKSEYYRLGSTLLYKQLLAANERIAELEAKIKTLELEKEATKALSEMAAFRARVLGDVRCTIDEQDASVKCPEGVKRAEEIQQRPDEP